MNRIIAVSSFLMTLPAVGQSLVSLRLQPPVIVPGQTTTLVLQAQTSGTPSRVTFESTLQPGVEVDMTAQGSGIYTTSLPVAPILAAMRSDDVYRPLLGYLRPYNGASASRYNIVGEVADPSIPRLTVTQDAADVQHTNYIVNILMPGAFPPVANPTIGPGQSAIAKRFFQLFPDNFDVLNIIYIPQYFQNRFHYGVRNAVKGIGSPILDI